MHTILTLGSVFIELAMSPGVCCTANHLPPIQRGHPLMTETQNAIDRQLHEHSHSQQNIINSKTCPLP